MIVVAIIGILASLAVSAYQTYTVRAQVAEALNMASGAKVPVIDAFNNDGEPPLGRAEAGMTPTAADSSGRYVSQVDITLGRIDVTFGNQVHQDIFGDVVTLTPYMSSGSAVAIWRCGFAPITAGALPLSGPSTTSAYRLPTIEERYLPKSCRS